MIYFLWRLWRDWRDREKIELQSLHPYLLDTRNAVIEALDKQDAPSRYLLAELEARRIALKKVNILCPKPPSTSDDFQEWSDFLNKVTEYSSLGMLKEARSSVRLRVHP